MLTLTAFTFTACEEESPYSSYRVNFFFDATIHPYNQAKSPGQFICVRRGNNPGQYRLTDALGNTQNINIPQIQLQQSPFHYGLGGLIIGTPMTMDGNLWAFDWACPSCEKAPSHSCQILDAGEAVYLYCQWLSARCYIEEHPIYSYRQFGCMPHVSDGF